MAPMSRSTRLINQVIVISGDLFRWVGLSQKTVIVINKKNIYIYICIYISWIFQVCKVCELFAKKNLPKGRTFYISEGSTYMLSDEQKKMSLRTPQHTLGAYPRNP